MGCKSGFNPWKIGWKVLILGLLSGCGGGESQSNLSPSGLDHPEKVEKALSEREAQRAKNQELERKFFRGKQIDSGEAQ